MADKSQLKAPALAPGRALHWPPPCPAIRQQPVQQKPAAALHWPPVYRPQPSAPVQTKQVQPKANGPAPVKPNPSVPRQANKLVPKHIEGRGRIGASVIQRIVMHLNQGTGRWFDLSFSDNKIEMEENEMSRMQNPEPHHSGHLKYRWNKDPELGLELHVKELQSDPEEGTGIGVFLMYAAARLGQSKGVKWVRVLTMARDKQTYYNKFGFDVAARQEALKKEYLSKGAKANQFAPTIGDLEQRGDASKEEWAKTLGVGEATVSTAKLLEKTAASLTGRWKTIGTTVAQSSIRF